MLGGNSLTAPIAPIAPDEVMPCHLHRDQEMWLHSTDGQGNGVEGRQVSCAASWSGFEVMPVHQRHVTRATEGNQRGGGNLFSGV